MSVQSIWNCTLDEQLELVVTMTKHLLVICLNTFQSQVSQDVVSVCMLMTLTLSCTSYTHFQAYPKAARTSLKSGWGKRWRWKQIRHREERSQTHSPVSALSRVHDSCTPCISLNLHLSLSFFLWHPHFPLPHLLSPQDASTSCFWQLPPIPALH